MAKINNVTVDKEIKFDKFGIFEIFIFTGGACMMCMFAFFSICLYLSELHFKNGLILAHVGNIGGASDEYLKAIEYSPLQTRYYIEFGHVLLLLATVNTSTTTIGQRLDIAKMAEKIYLIALEKNNRNPSLLAGLGDTYMVLSSLDYRHEKKYLQNAEEAYSKTLEMDHNNQHLRLLMRNFYNKLGKHDKAMLYL